MRPVLVSLVAAVLALGAPSAARAETGLQKLGACLARPIECAKKITGALVNGPTPPPAPPPPPVPPPPPPPPTPPPPPPPITPRAFIVYFEFDSAVLSPTGQAVVSAAAAFAAQGGAPRVLIVGHADTAGDDAYNLGLSERRAKATADALVAQGVPLSTITVDWKGEARLAVPTGDEVPEPLNRRAEITIGD